MSSHLPVLLERSREVVFKTTFADIETILRTGETNDTGFESECDDISHLGTPDEAREMLRLKGRDKVAFWLCEQAMSGVFSRGHE